VLSSIVLDLFGIHHMFDSNNYSLNGSFTSDDNDCALQLRGERYTCIFAHMHMTILRSVCYFCATALIH